MTPAARYAAAIEIFDRTLLGAPAERELTRWARGNRFAGSKDRAAIRDIVYDGLRNLRSYAHYSGVGGARGVFIGRLIANNEELTSVFNGEGYAPSTISYEENKMIYSSKADMTLAIKLDIPDWLVPNFNGKDEYSVLKERAPIDLRVNLKKINLDNIIASLLKEGIKTEPLDVAKTALRVIGETRKIPQTNSYLNGLIELQDAGSQALVLELNFPNHGKVLDYCAGGGGKTLAIASLISNNVILSAFDRDPDRLKALSHRADRAGIHVELLKKDPVIKDEKFDFVVLDVPCSGSGAWRRTPDAKWKLTPARLEELLETQADILNTTSNLVTENGTLVYMTCSLFASENEEQISNFIERVVGWKLTFSKHFELSSGTDGFYLAILNRL